MDVVDLDPPAPVRRVRGDEDAMSRRENWSTVPESRRPPTHVRRGERRNRKRAARVVSGEAKTAPLNPPIVDPAKRDCESREAEESHELLAVLPCPGTCLEEGVKKGRNASALVGGEANFVLGGIPEQPEELQFFGRSQAAFR